MNWIEQAAWGERLITIARQAGEAILEIYAQDFSVQTKDDHSPLTAADLASHRIITHELSQLTPDIPVLSEEAADISWESRRHWPRHWLVDPLDGTREFVKRNGEFSVNIALVQQGEPVLAVIYAPVTGYLAHARKGAGAWLRDAATGQDIRLGSQRPAPAPLRIIASRSHLDERTIHVLNSIGEHERQALGSSLKFCRIAEGRADVYPRFGPTSEWDTAAGQCILEAAGGIVIDHTGAPLRYNQRPSLINTDFLALGDGALPWQDWL